MLGIWNFCGLNFCEITYNLDGKAGMTRCEDGFVVAMMSVPVNAGNSQDDKSLAMRRNPALAKSANR